MTEATTTKPNTRHSWAERTEDTSSMSVTFTYEDGTSAVFKAADFPEAVQKRALVRGLSVAVGKYMNHGETLAEAKQLVEQEALQLMDGIWSAGKPANPANKLAVAYVQLAMEQNKTITIKSAKEQIAKKETAQPGFAAAKMADEKFASAYVRAQAKTDTTLDDL